VYDYDTEKPLKNVCIKIDDNITHTDSLGHFSLRVKSNSAFTIFLKRDRYAVKKVFRKPDSLGKFSRRNLKNNIIYLYTKESDFSNKGR